MRLGGKGREVRRATPAPDNGPALFAARASTYSATHNVTERAVHYSDLLVVYAETGTATLEANASIYSAISSETISGGKGG